MKFSAAGIHQLSEAGESLPLGQLADRLSCVKSNVTQLVDRLEADGLVTRSGDPNDRRARLAVLTVAGRRAYLTGSAIRTKVERELFGVLTGEEADTLHKLLGKLQP